MADINPNKFASSITNAIFANYQDGSDVSFEDLSTTAQTFVTQSSLYQNNNSPLFAAQREADALMTLKQRRLMVFEYVKRISVVQGSAGQRMMEPQWESISMYINPESIQVSTQKLKGKAVTRGGIYYHHWGDDHWGIQISGKTGLSGMKGIEALEKIYHHSGTLLRYQAAGPTLDYERVEDPYSVISFGSTSDLLEEYMNDSSGNIRSKIKESIVINSEIDTRNEERIAEYDKLLAERTQQMNLNLKKKSFVNSLGIRNLSVVTSFIDRLREFEEYQKAYGEAQDELKQVYDSMLSGGSQTKIDHALLYNEAVKISSKYFGGTIGPTQTLTYKYLDENKKEQEAKKNILSSPEIISAMAVQLAQDIIFIRDEERKMDSELLTAIEQYISDTYDANQQNILKNLNANDPAKYNVLKFYENMKKEVATDGFGKVDDVSMEVLEPKVNLRDAVLEALKDEETTFFNKKSRKIQEYIDNLSGSRENSIDSIIYKMLETRRKEASSQLQRIRDWEDRESNIRKLLITKGMETMEDMFEDEWLPRRIIMYFENRAYIGHFENFNYRRDAASNLISYDMRFVAERQILGTLY